MRVRPWEGGRLRTASLLQLDFEFSGASLDLEAARAQRRALDRHGITVLIVPARYRAAATSLQDAEGRARTALAEGRAAAPALPLRLLSDHPMFFTFLGDGAGPDGSGRRGEEQCLIRVDKCDGHVWSDAEMHQHLALVGPR